jgi:predicted esterase
VLLVGVVGCLTVGLLGTQVPTAEDRARLWNQFYAAYDAKDWPTAIRLGEQVAAASPEDPAAAFYVACVHARAGHRDEALAWLERAADRGCANLELLDADPGLAVARGDARYGPAREAIARNRDAAVQQARAKAPDAPIVFHVPGFADDRSPIERPLIVALHGYGSSPADMLPAFRALADATGAVLALPQALKPHGAGYDWVSTDQAEVVVLGAIESARKRAPFDPRQIVLAGFSQGAGMAMRVALRHPDRVRGVLAMAGYHDERLVPGPNAERARRLRVALLVGGDDDYAASNREAEQRLRAARFPVLLRVFPNVGHRLPPNAIAEMKDAIAFLLR